MVTTLITATADRDGVRHPLRVSLVARREDDQTAQRPGHCTADVAALGDARDRERDHDVEQQRRADARGERVDAAVACSPTNAAAISPNTAPEAPPCSPSGCSNIAPADPPSRAAKYTSAKRIRPIAGSSIWPSMVQQEHVEREVDDAEVQEPRRDDAVPLAGVGRVEAAVAERPDGSRWSMMSAESPSSSWPLVTLRLRTLSGSSAAT